MIGPITDSSALFIGGLAGTLFSGLIPNRVKETLPLIFGVITLCMGSTLVNKASALPVVVTHLCRIFSCQVHQGAVPPREKQALRQ